MADLDGCEDGLDAKVFGWVFEVGDVGVFRWCVDCRGKNTFPGADELHPAVGGVRVEEVVAARENELDCVGVCYWAC